MLASGTEVHEVHKAGGGTAVDVKLTAASQEYVNTAILKEEAEATYENLDSMNKVHIGNILSVQTSISILFRVRNHQMCLVEEPESSWYLRLSGLCLQFEPVKILTRTYQYIKHA